VKGRVLRLNIGLIRDKGDQVCGGLQELSGERVRVPIVLGGDRTRPVGR
jgi:hypothetical protein